MEQYIELISVPVIVGIVYAIISVLKIATKENEKFMRFIPLLALVLGVICGVVAFYCVPGYVEASNIFVAMVIGGASGLSATGTNQIFKQINKNIDDEDKGDK